MIKKKELDLFEESYNEGYESGIIDLLSLLKNKNKTKEDTTFYNECAKKLLGRKIKE